MQPNSPIANGHDGRAGAADDDDVGAREVEANGVIRPSLWAATHPPVQRPSRSPTNPATTSTAETSVGAASPMPATDRSKHASAGARNRLGWP